MKKLGLFSLVWLMILASSDFRSAYAACDDKCRYRLQFVQVAKGDEKQLYNITNCERYSVLTCIRCQKMMGLCTDWDAPVYEGSKCQINTGVQK